MYQLKDKLGDEVQTNSVLFEIPSSTIETGGVMAEKATNAIRQGGEPKYSGKDGYSYFFFKYTDHDLYNQFTAIDVAGLCTPAPTGLGGEVFNYFLMIEVDPSAQVPSGIRDSIKTDDQGVESQKTWSEWASNLVTQADGKSFVSSRDKATGTQTKQALDTGLQGTELLILMSAGLTVMTETQYNAAYPTLDEE